MVWAMRFAVVFALFVNGAAPLRAQADRWQPLREKMVRDTLSVGGIRSQRVLDAMRDTPRHLFVPRHLRAMAYQDMALPIGESQTISSPFIVAFMTECLDPQATDRVLEIGTGSGYQAAVLGPLAKDVYTIEIVPELGHQATKLLKQLRHTNIHVRVGDGFQGWPEHAPFDKIIVTCSPEDVPQPLIDQLREGGRMVIPVGERYQQTMYLFRKTDGELKKEALRPTLFVPMTGKAEASRERQPDPSNPQIINPSFEEGMDEQGFIRGWYYQRQAQVKASTDAPAGKSVVRFEASRTGEESHLMQGLGMDGRKVRQVRLQTWVRTEGVTSQADPQSGPRLAITFYDEERRELATRWLGPWSGDAPWQQVSETIRVPGNTREMIIRIGLFGAVGVAEFDGVELNAVP
uniref:Protein-L-isoaspartate O-methyltransferase n=1 Tax=uncultured bacterium A1Q1_fos_962 TaxID=1256592 RepID=L7VXJ9_9BACT|nr:protein-L-isoaspartate O-methyltransferase [uncultured bacterium A1Q1_fos_962]